jgi:hypothetical protein
VRNCESSLLGKTLFPGTGESRFGAEAQTEPVYQIHHRREVAGGSFGCHRWGDLSIFDQLWRRLGVLAVEVGGRTELRHSSFIHIDQLNIDQPLPSTVLKNQEISGPEIIDEDSVLVCDDDINSHPAHTGLEHRPLMRRSPDSEPRDRDDGN